MEDPMTKTTIIAFVCTLLAACTQEELQNDIGADSSDLITDTGADFEGTAFEPDSVEALFYEGENPVWVLTAKDDETWLYIENYPSFDGATNAETRTLDDTDVNYATCGVCVLLKTGCQQHGDHGHCARTYMPEVGSRVTFDELGDEVGSNWSGSTSPMRFVEVSIDSATYETTPLSDGDTIDLSSWTFEAVLEEG